MTKPLIRVLLVEDDAVDRMACRRALARNVDYEFALSEAESGHEGLQLAHEQKPDCVLLDYHLPDLNGLEFLAALTDDTGDVSIPVMMLTGTDNATIAVEAMKRGARDYLIKDMEHQYLELLPAVIQRVLSERRMLTEKKLAEDKLAQAEAKYRSLVETIPAIVYIATLDGTNRFLYVSTRIETLGFPPEEWLNDPDILLARIHPDDRPRALEERAKSRATGAPLRCEYRLISHDGTVLWFRDEASVVRDESGRSLFLQGILVDITESKQAEAELREHRYRLEELVAKRTDELAKVNAELRRDIAERKLIEEELTKAKTDAEKANLAKSDFLSSMSHELRSPLNVMLGFAQLLESSSPTPTFTQKTMLKEINVAGWYLLELINKILDLATIESGKLVVSQEPMCIAEAMAESRTMIEPQAQERGIQLIFPPPDMHFFVKADRTRVKQVLINLLSNAIKYNREGGTVEVTCTVTAPGRIRVSIRDTGTGLPPEKLTQLFQQFNRLGQEAGSVEGTGIGLVVTKQLVELMGGEIGVESTVGEGSVFWFELIADDASKPATIGSKSEELGTEG
ncbi:hybrid sensor histidine kinase/response regulator [Nitrosovibrio sp. Nv4]|uniref:hybrid sensor histidine kinase/response regulator n=1 Tax=Nitrosovibrio sp. Nv4 TaxID=1945880 RepID=UPI000BD10B05|nr:ATP-binding protein [Nitrosovibrio sp. Nv4]SOD41533.1 PAS domain S-box-containing protein [Nitrosovibrio sp. Nv4]